MASWLADAGSGGAAEYLPADSLLAGYVSMQEPWQLFQEFTVLMTKNEESFASSLAEVEEKLGAGFIANLTAGGHPWMRAAERHSSIRNKLIFRAGRALRPLATNSISGARTGAG
jgi:hypothetical protein